MKHMRDYSQYKDMMHNYYIFVFPVIANTFNTTGQMYVGPLGGALVADVVLVSFVTSGSHWGGLCRD